MDLSLNAFRSPDLGPRDGSILHLQQQHRSREVWEADRTRPVDSKKVRVRSAKKGIRALPWPSPPVLELIRRARLEGLCSLPFVSVDWGLITALLERWWPETHTFHLQPGESTITLQDVEVLLGIPVDGKPVTGNTNLKPNDLCKHLLGEQPTEESDINGMKVKASWLSDRFTGQVEKGADPEVVARQARGYLLLLMGETIFADHSRGYVHLANLERLENFDEAGTYSWGSGALANLYHNLCHGCKAGTKQITGCFILLQVWAWERLPYFAPGRLGKRAPKAGAPLIGRWDDIFHSPDLATHLVGSYRYHLDIQRPDVVIWTPYSEELLESLPEYCRAGRAVWRATVPLIYYATCQYHQPDRVMRQFSFRQCIPPPSRSLDPPHGKTLQSGALDWALKYRTIIEVWNYRLNLVVPPSDIDLVEYPFDDPYVAWYDRITKRCISRVGCGVDGVTRCLKALNMPGVPAAYRDVALAGLMHMGVFQKFLRLQPPQHGVFKGNQELGEHGEGVLEEELQPQDDAAGHGHDHPHVEHPNDNIPIPQHAPPPHEPSFSPLPHFASFVMSPSIFDSPVVEPTSGGGSSSQTCSHSEVPWEQLEVVGFGASTLSHDSLVQAKRRKIDESSLGDVGGSVRDGDITQLGLDTQDFHVDPQHEAEVELDFVSNNDGQDDEVEEEADFQESIVGGDRKGGREVTQSTTKTPVVAQRRSKRQRKKPRCVTGGTMCKDGGEKTKRACH
ncbi:serine/threonine-protein phosphatase 7 long form homolog [Rhododendron vialii]|uniref:serine/threonine-protein phosphatase 7 long form homolog n=1 Tax=Rhododendron vialii TaxID=182163 RepID=UPI00265FDF30|nr:serine/threonine-protein phosphatase 7 long form homolog [Rhododendron vialii]